MKSSKDSKFHDIRNECIQTSDHNYIFKLHTKNNCIHLNLSKATFEFYLKSKEMCESLKL